MKVRKIKMINQNKTVTDTVSVNRKRLINNDSPFAIKEAYVKLRTSLMFCMKADKEGPCKVFAITSANPSEGKSLTAANIAISYAMLGKKTLLIDADMRKPTQRRLWKVDISTGLCDFLAGMGQLELVKVDGLPLSIVCTGTIPPNPSELLASDIMKQFIKRCTKTYDYIIIDTPPTERFVALLLVALTIMAFLPSVTLPSAAATSGTVAGLSDENIGLSFTGSADNAWNATATGVIGKVQSTPGGTCDPDTKYRSTLTITNNKTTKATLSFDYAVVVSDGTILVNNATATANGRFSKELEAGGTVEVEIESGSTNAATMITMTNVKLVSDVTATTTFLPAENGSYTVDGKKVTEKFSKTQSSTQAYALVATPASGYKFYGWYSVTEDKLLSTDLQTSLNIDADKTISTALKAECTTSTKPARWFFRMLKTVRRE